MIRLVAFACGLLCGSGLVISGLFDPSFLHAFLMPGGAWVISLGVGLVVATLVGGMVITMARNRDVPLLAQTTNPESTKTGWKPLAGALLFGLGWGIAGYFPLSALVSAGMFSPGAVIFLISVLGGMITQDLITGGGRFSLKGLLSRG